MHLPGIHRYGRYCPSYWLMHLANWGLSLAGAPVAFTDAHRVAGCPLRLRHDRLRIAACP